MTLQSKLNYDFSKIMMLLADIDALDHNEPSNLRKPLLSRLRKEIMFLHEAEEKTLYKTLQDSENVQGLIEQLKEEHLHVKNILHELSNITDDTSKHWHKVFTELKGALKREVKDEKALIKRAKEELPQNTNEKLEQDIIHKKQDLWQTKTMDPVVALKADFTESVRAAA